MTLSDTAVADVVAAMGVLPESFWSNQDDACDCTFQRIGMWKNPFLGETLEVRLCCIWGELYKLFPQHVRVTPAYLVDDKEWDTRVWDWDGEQEMPEAIWYRHLARKHGVPVAKAREMFAHLPRPQGTPRPQPEPPREPTFASMFGAFALQVMERLAALEAK